MHPRWRGFTETKALKRLSSVVFPFENEFLIRRDLAAPSSLHYIQEALTIVVEMSVSALFFRSTEVKNYVL